MGQMRVLVSTTNKFCLLWTPKAGCSTATSIFFAHEGFMCSKRVWIHKCREEYEKSVHLSIIPKNSSSYAKVQFVRDPHERAVSSYFVYCDHHKDHGSFFDFLRMVRDSSLGCTHCDFHSAPQFMTEDVDMLVRIEKLEEDLASVNARYGFKLDPSMRYDPHSSRRRIALSGYDPESVYHFLIHETGVKELIEEIYAKDVNFTAL